MPLAYQALLILLFSKADQKKWGLTRYLNLSVAFDCQYDVKIELSLTLTVFRCYEYTRQGSASNSDPCHVDRSCRSFTQRNEDAECTSIKMSVKAIKAIWQCKVKQFFWKFAIFLEI